MDFRPHSRGQRVEPIPATRADTEVVGDAKSDAPEIAHEGGAIGQGIRYGDGLQSARLASRIPAASPAISAAP